MLLMLQSLVANPAIASLFVIPLVLIVADFVSGVLAAFRSRDFHPVFLPEFMSRQVVPFVATVGVSILVGLAMGQSLDHIALGAHGILVPFYAAQLDSIVVNVAAMFGLDHATSLGVVRAVFAKLFPKEAADLPLDGSVGPTPESVAPAVAAPADAPAAS